MKLILLLIYFFILIPYSYAKDVVKEINVSCLNKETFCHEYIGQFNFLVGIEFSEVNPRLNVMLSDSMFDYLKYSWNKGSLDIVISPKKRLRNLNISNSVGLQTDDLLKQVNLRIDDYINDEKKNNAVKSIEKFFNEKGYILENVKISEKYYKDQVDLHFEPEIKNRIILKKINITTNSNTVNRDIRQRLKKYLHKPWDRISFRVDYDEFIREVISRGYFLLNNTIDVKYDDYGNGEVVISIETGPRYQFSFNGNDIISRADFIGGIKQAFENAIGNSIASEEIKDVIRALYEKRGFYGTEVDLNSHEGTTIFKDDYISYYVDIREGNKVRARFINFNGNISVGENELRDLLYENSSVLVSRGFYDSDFFSQFSKIIKQYYLKRGYALVNVSDPKITWSMDKKEVRVDYSIRERQQTFVKSINIKNVPEDIREKVLESITNKAGEPLDVVSVQDDIGKALKIAQERGHIFANFDSESDANIVTYSNAYQSADITLDFVLKEKTVFKDIVVTGNRLTKDLVVKRELRLIPGDIITPSVLMEYRDRLVQLGIFSNVKIVPYINKESTINGVSETTLFVQVTERDFGLLEIAPGFRTDIGAKISAGINYNNLWGTNHTVGFNVQANQRFHYDELDARRSNAKKKVLEYQAKANYVVPYVWQNVFVKPLSLDMSASFQRKRFYAFDADITRISPTLNYSFSRVVSMGVKYQFEAISQFDASNEKDNDNFTIGSITPSLTLDFRDDPINPRKGYYFSLSWEFANPYFLSAKDDDLIVNFSKVIQRNRIYIPMGKNWVLATSLSWGHQENYATAHKTDEFGNIIYGSDGRPLTKGYIPSIKVFRLDGIDTVRGFGDDEINRLISGPNIGDVTINNQAFFLNFKLEPRYYISDSMLVGLFFDAGRVYQDSFRPLSLRTSVGASFKFLTPVGSLDFDYGVKLRREELNSSNKEAFGRFHLSIGFF